jgi:hypothetical protein
MPVATLYHPISLYVIRGSMIHNGWKPGRISQMHSNSDRGTAYYRLTINVVPKALSQKSGTVLKEALQKCFMDDIYVVDLSTRSEGGFWAHLSVDLKRGDIVQASIPESAYTIENLRSINGADPDWLNS